MAHETPSDRAPVGRPDKLTPETYQFIVQAVRETVDVEVAAEARNVSRRTLETWRQRSRKYVSNPDKYARWQKYSEFWRDVKAAEAFSEVSLVNVIRRSAMENTSDAKWLLERRHKRRWQPSQALEHTGAGGEGPVEFVLATPKPRALDADHFGEPEKEDA